MPAGAKCFSSSSYAARFQVFVIFGAGHDGSPGFSRVCGPVGSGGTPSLDVGRHGAVVCHRPTVDQEKGLAKPPHSRL